VFDAAPDPQSLKFAIAALAALAALGFIALHWHRRRRARAALEWPLAPGTVTASRTARRWGLGIGLWMAGLWYVPDVAYRYQVGGEKYSGRRVFLSDTGFSRLGRAKDVIARYPRGADVAVRYDPANPKRACLEPVYRERRALGAAGLLLAVAAAALLAG
jgi:hypothetical protein